MKHIIRAATGTLVAGMLAAGCSTSPTASDTAAANTAMNNAARTIEHAGNDPYVAKYASAEMARAKDSLRRAEATWKDKHDLQATTHLAYLAQQRAATAQELANERAAENALAVAVADRDHALSVAMAKRRAAAAAAATATPRQLAQQDLAGFAFGVAALPAGSMPKIDELAATLKNNPGSKVVIEGHTDNVGSSSYNKALAMKRAQAVSAALLQHGIDPTRIIVGSAGEANPVASNDTSAGRRDNRRAEVIISGPGGPMAGSSESATGASSGGQQQQSGQ